MDSFANGIRETINLIEHPDFEGIRKMMFSDGIPLMDGTRISVEKAFDYENEVNPSKHEVVAEEKRSEIIQGFVNSIENRKPQLEKSLENKAGKTVIIEVIKDKCSGCGLCFKSCPYDAFEFEPYMGNKSGKVAKINEKCGLCNLCLNSCKFGAIKENVGCATINSIDVEMESSLSANELAYLTGLTENECQNFMTINNMNGDEALEAIDICMQSLNENISVPVEIVSCMNNAEIYIKMSNNLGAYNTMRGGVKGYGGFVFEELHAADAASKGLDINVLGNNGIADFIVKDASGHESLVQAKAGYKSGQINWEKYNGQTIVVDKGNTSLANEARAAGLNVQESSVYKKEADIVARTQQLESKITGSTSAPITGTIASAHYAGLKSAKLAARVGVSMKIGENIYDVVSGEKNFSDAAADVVVDGAVLVGGAYIGGAALTAAGTAIMSTGTIIAGTTAGAVVTGAVATAATAVGGTAVGGAVIAGAGAVAAGAGAVAAGAATAVSAVAAAPLVPVIAIGAAVGFFFKSLKK